MYLFNIATTYENLKYVSLTLFKNKKCNTYKPQSCKEQWKPVLLRTRPKRRCGRTTDNCTLEMPE
jgi:hypothetical protein